jgi:hypothetical protein
MGDGGPNGFYDSFFELGYGGEPSSFFCFFLANEIRYRGIFAFVRDMDDHRGGLLLETERKCLTKEGDVTYLAAKMSRKEMSRPALRGL